jgi:hypothetical protein
MLERLSVGANLYIEGLLLVPVVATGVEVCLDEFTLAHDPCMCKRNDIVFLDRCRLVNFPITTSLQEVLLVEGIMDVTWTLIQI